jgi:hypothetical protein
MNPQASGWDIHRKFSRVSLMEISTEGEIHAVERARLEHDDREGMRQWLARLDAEIPVALEAAWMLLKSPFPSKRTVIALRTPATAFPISKSEGLRPGRPTTSVSA